MKRSLCILLGLGLAACGGNADAPPPVAPSAPGEQSRDEASSEAAVAQSASEVKAPGEAREGDTTTCPVSGEEFVVEGSSLTVEHDGKTYFFCCSGCKKKFEEDPAKFLTQT